MLVNWYQFLCPNQVDFSVGTARKDIAVEMYKKGIQELEKGIAVDVSGEGKLALLVLGCTLHTVLNFDFLQY